jgi:hypothetical protein
MAKGNDDYGRVTKWLRWIARIWSLPIIVIALIIFAGYGWSWVTTGVADPHAVEDYPPIENVPPILLFISVLCLGVAWRWERLGGTIAVVLLLATVVVLLISRPFTEDFSRWAIPYLLVVIVAVPAVLFLVCSRRSRA